jgi:hypothetical protein
MQASIPAQYTGTLDGFRKIVGAEGVSGLYKGLYPLWGRQIPYTMMKFASFETIVEMIYARLPGSKNDYSKAAQTGVSFAAGYLAGILCAIVSHPADVMVSKLNAYRKPGEGFGAVTSRIYKDIGFMGLWNGLPVRIVMIGTLTGLQWMIYVSLPGGRGSEIETGTDSFAGLFQDLYGLPDDGRCAAAAEEGVRFERMVSSGWDLSWAVLMLSKQASLITSVVKLFVYSCLSFHGNPMETGYHAMRAGWLSPPLKFAKLLAAPFSLNQDVMTRSAAQLVLTLCGPQKSLGLFQPCVPAYSMQNQGLCGNSRCLNARPAGLLVENEIHPNSWRLEANGAA